MSVFYVVVVRGAPVVHGIDVALHNAFRNSHITKRTVFYSSDELHGTVCTTCGHIRFYVWRNVVIQVIQGTHAPADEISDLYKR